MFFDDFSTIFVACLVGDAFKDSVSDVDHVFQHDGGKARACEFFFRSHCPESVGEVVVLHRRVALNPAVAAVMVGEEQTLVADEFASAAASEEHHGVFHGAVIDGINVVGSDFHAHSLHLGFVTLKQSRNPHAFVSTGNCAEKEDCNCC